MKNLNEYNPILFIIVIILGSGLSMVIMSIIGLDANTWLVVGVALGYVLAKYKK